MNQNWIGDFPSKETALYRIDVGSAGLYRYDNNLPYWQPYIMPTAQFIIEDKTTKAFALAKKLMRQN